MPFIFITGKQTSLEPLGWSARRCERCQCVVPFMILNRASRRTVYFVEVFASHEVAALCCFCEDLIGLSEMPVITKDWVDSEGLFALVKNTAPELLPEVGDAAEPSERQFLALLDTLVRRCKRGNVTGSVGPFVVLGGILGIPIGIGVGWLKYQLGFMNNIREGMETSCALFAILFCGLMAVGGLFLDARLRYRRKLRAQIKDAVENHGLNIQRWFAAARAANHPAAQVMEALL